MSQAPKSSQMPVTAFRETIDRGLVAHRAGRLEDAIVAYRAALSLQADDAEATSLLGLAIAQCGRGAEGVELLRRAALRGQDQAGLLFNLAEGLTLAGQPDDALSTLRQVMELQPDSAAAWSRSAEIHAQRGQLSEATHCWAEAMEIDPRAIRPIVKLAELALQHGDPDKAIALLEIGLSQHPAQEEMLGVLCEALAARRDWSRLAATARAWADARPQRPEPWKHLSRAAFEFGRHADAVQAYSNFLLHGRHDTSDLATYAGLCLHAHDFAAAEAALTAAEEVDANHPEVLARRALLHMYRGRFAAALEAAQRCLERQPGDVYVLSTVSRLQQGTLDAAQLARLSVIAERTDAPLDLRIPAAFAIAHAQDAASRFEEAFAAYARAHALSTARDETENRRYDRAGQEERTRRLRELFATAEPAASAPRQPGGTARRPVFIVGLPRTGSTLVESVLGAHPRVHACGERGAMQRLLGEYLARAAESQGPGELVLGKWAEAYLAEPAAAAACDFVTDKQPLNFFAIGLIMRLFPDALVLHLRRDPLETLFSIWRQEFAKSWAFTHRFEDLAHYYVEYMRLMAHWEQLFPGRLISLRYEQIVADFPQSAQQLLAACGLDWSAEVLDYARSERPIATFSTVSVRDPVSLRNGRVARYGDLLQPLVDALRQAGVDPQSGELLPGGVVPGGVLPGGLP